MTMVYGSRELGARLHQWHAGMDAIYAVGSQFYAGRPAPLRDVKEALRLLEQEHRNRKATKMRRDAVTHLNAVIADLHDAMWSAIGEHGDPDAGTGYPRENPAPIVRQRVTELLPDVVIHYTAHGVWLRGMPRSYRGDRMWAASGVDEAREMAAYLARGLRATGAARGIEIAQGSPEKARRSR